VLTPEENEQNSPTPELTTWGVGPWQGDLPTGPGSEVYDPELLREGDTRNVVDKYRYWSMEAIVAELDSRRHSYHVAIENWQHDLNIGSIVRTANAFLAKEVHIIGNRRWNRRGAMVTDRYQHIKHHPTIELFLEWANTASDSGGKIPIIAIDNVPGCKQIESFPLPKNCVLLFGQEGPGLSQDALDAATEVVEITQYGSTRSINASAAAAITMHQWIMQHKYSN
jgi:tRNA G18 (ribose-2'-O)-methylase SpoU